MSQKALIRSRHERHKNSFRIQVKLPHTHESHFLKQDLPEKTTLSSICRCNLCSNKYLLKEVSDNSQSNNSSMFFSSNDQTSLYVILSSIIGKNKKKGLQIHIPETCFYKNGKPETMFTNSHQQVKMICAKRFSSRQVLKEFLKRRKEAKHNFQDLIESSSKQLSEIHEKHFQRLKPSYKPMIKPEQLKQHMYRVHRDSEYEILQDKKQTQSQACITYFQDGTYLLLTQGQFGTIKNNSPHLQKLSYIQILIPSVETIISQFNQYSSINHKDLWNKARTQVEILLGEISVLNLKYIGIDESQQFYKLLKITPQTYAMYETFKIIHYISKVTDTIIYSLKLNWSVTKEKEYYLMNVVSINYRNRDPRQIKRMLENQLQQLRQKNNPQLQQIQQMQQIMVSKWKSLKREKSIENQEQFVKDSGVKVRKGVGLNSSLSFRTPKILPKLFRNHSLHQSNIV